MTDLLQMRGMRILLVTTVTARKMLEKVLSEFEDKDLEFGVFVSSAQVASLTTVRKVVEELKSARVSVKNYDLVILPGMIRGSAEVLEKEFGVAAVKGTMYVGDLPEMLGLLKKNLKFSAEVPADRIIKEHLEFTYEERVKEMIQQSSALFYIKGVKFSLTPPPLNLFYEYMQGDVDGLREMIRKLRILDYQGVVIGCEASCKDTSKVLDLIDIVNDEGLISGIDVPLKASNRKDLLEKADLVMNITSRQLDDIGQYLGSSSCIVVIPESVDSLGSVLESLNKGVLKAQEIGVNKLIIDPMVRPPLLGLAESIRAFMESIEKLRYPHMFGLSNVYELIDADSIGVISTLMTIAFEIGASQALVTESSRKAYGASKEASIAREMIYRAHVRKSPPLNTGVSLLVLKDKRDVSVDPPEVTPGEIVQVDNFIPLKMDRRYYVKIYVDRSARSIVVDVISRRSGRTLARFVGKDPLSLGRAIIRRFRLGSEHSMYLGRELNKASLALRLGKNYIQDVPLFEFSYE